MKYRYLLLLLVCIVTGCVTPNECHSAPSDAGPKPVERRAAAQRKLDVQGAWVATVYNLDIGKQQNATAYRKEIQALFNKLSAARVNTIYFQVRSFNDAYYYSRINPWSRWLTGREGVGIIGLDPLRVALEEAHKRKITLHAWINPYRVGVINASASTTRALNQLAPGNFARKHPECVMAVSSSDGKKYLLLNPGMPASQQHIFATVKELLDNYALDGIHLDDYFYPYAPMGNEDEKTAALYNTRHLPIDDWRRSNTDNLVYSLSLMVRNAAKVQHRKIEFGISPFGIWANKKHNPAGSMTAGFESYYGLYSDSRKWIKNGWVDYIVPQLYWSCDMKKAPFPELVKWWSAQTSGTPVKLYIGIALSYASPGEKWSGTKEIEKQMKCILQAPQVKGAVMFHAKGFK